MVESEMEETGRHTHKSSGTINFYTLLLIVADSSVLLNIHSVAIYFCTRDVFPFFFCGGRGGGRTVSFTCTQRRAHARIDLFLFQIAKSRIVFRQSCKESI